MAALQQEATLESAEFLNELRLRAFTLGQQFGLSTKTLDAFRRACYFDISRALRLEPSDLHERFMHAFYGGFPNGAAMASWYLSLALDYVRELSPEEATAAGQEFLASVGASAAVRIRGRLSEDYEAGAPALGAAESELLDVGRDLGRGDLLAHISNFVCNIAAPHLDLLSSRVPRRVDADVVRAQRFFERLRTILRCATMEVALSDIKSMNTAQPLLLLVRAGYLPIDPRNGYFDLVVA